MPKFENGRFDINGTHLQGYIETRYSTLVQVFGEPTFEWNGDDKTTVEWNLQFEDGTVATIYDYHTYQTPFGTYDWHIGGKTPLAKQHVLDAVHEALEGNSFYPELPVQSITVRQVS